MRIIPAAPTSDAGFSSGAPRQAVQPSSLIHHPYLLLVPLLVAAMSLASTLSPNDFWGHAAAGRWIAQHGAVPTTNLFSWGVPLDTPYPYPSWAAAWLMYQTLNWTGLTGMVGLRALCAAGAWGILCWAAWRRVRRVAPGVPAERAAQCVAFAALLAFGMAGTNLDARPQMFALPLFACGVALLLELPYMQRPRYGALIAVFAGTVLWANFHGSFFLAVALPLGALAGEALRGAALKLKTSGSNAPLRRAKLLFLLAWVTVAVAATLVNPRGLHVWDYIFTLTSNSTVQQYIYEWQPPRFGEGPGTVFFGGFGVLLALGLLARGKSAVRAGETLVLLALFVMGCRSLRSVLWFALFFVPIASAIAGAYLALRAGSEPARDPARRGVPGAWPKLACGVLLLACVALWPPLKARLPLPEGFRARYAPPPAGEVPFILDAVTPVAAAQQLRARPPRRLWNDMGQGAYLAWALPPGTARCDWRIELFPSQFWLDYLRLSQGPAAASAQLRALGIQEVLCDGEAQAGLIRRLRLEQGWQAFELGKSVLFVRQRT